MQPEQPVGLLESIRQIEGEAEVHSNTRVAYIIITEDKMRLILNQYEKAVGARYAFAAAFTTAFTLGVTLASTDFKQLWFLSPADVRTALVVLFVLSVVLAFKAGLDSLRPQKEGSINYVIQAIRAERSSTSSP